MIRCPFYILLLCCAPLQTATAQQACVLDAKYVDDLVQITAAANDADWSGASYVMQVNTQHGSNRSINMQSGTVSDAIISEGVTNLSLTTVRIPEGGTAEVTVTLQKADARSQCALTITR